MHRVGAREACQGSRERALIGHAGGPGGGVGAAAGGHHGAGIAVSAGTLWGGRREMLAVQQHRCRGHPVGRHRGRDAGRPIIDEHEAQVGLARRLDAGAAAAGTKAARQASLHLDRWQLGHQQIERSRGLIALGLGLGLAHGANGNCSRPAVSGSPKTTLKACTACPAAPLTRLSVVDIARIRPMRSL